MKGYCIEIPVGDEEAMEKFQELMDIIQDETVKHIENVASELNISIGCASDVVYLRTRSRWTQDLENLLIQKHKDGNPPKNMGDFG